MNSALLVVAGLGIFFLGYRFYSRVIASRIYAINEDIVTPAHEFRDEVDYVSAERHILFGHHFTSVAGAALTLMVIIPYFWQRKEPVVPLFVPMLFVMIITLIILIIKTGDFYLSNTPLFVFNCMLLVLIDWKIVEDILSLKRSNKIKLNVE